MMNTSLLEATREKLMKIDIHSRRVGNVSDITQVDHDLYFNFAKEGEFLPFAQPACRQAGEERRDPDLFRRVLEILFDPC